MNLSVIKRAPRWAWYTAAGVTAGAVGIKLWKGRANDPSTSNDATQVGTPESGSPSYSPSPIPTVTPPVIIAGGGGDGGGFADLASAFTSTFASSLDNAVNTVGVLALGDQSLAGQALAANSDIAKTALMNAGSPPAPAAQNPTPITVVIPPPTSGPGPSAPAQPAPTADPCTGKYPYQSARGCYRVVLAHGERWHYYAPNDSPTLRVG
jgi:hypothetical protein